MPSNGIVVAGTDLSNSVSIGTGLGNGGIDIVQTAVSGTMRLGTGILLATGSKTFIGGILSSPQPAAGTVSDVTINAAPGPNFQRIGFDSSSRRFKEDIKPMNELSEAVFKLKPVTYRIKKEIDPAQPMAFGLIAEDVAEACPALAAYLDGQPLGVHYKEVTVMLLNEFLKEHRKVQEQEATIAQVKSNAAKQEATITELKSGMQTLAATVKSQAAQIQQVSAQLEASKPAPQVVNNNQ